jgi:F0F1-type ATP synthase assembly protein I
MNDLRQDKLVDPPGARLRQTGGGDNLVDLVGKLTSQGAHLAQEQVALMQAEVREAASDVKQAIAAYAGAAVLGLAGLGVTLMGVGWLLGDAIENGPLGVLIVGIVALVVAAILYSGAAKKTKAAHLKPERTIRTLADTPDAATGHFATGGKP